MLDKYMNISEEIKNGLLKIDEIDMAIVEIQHAISKLQTNSHAIKTSLLIARIDILNLMKI